MEKIWIMEGEGDGLKEDKRLAGVWPLGGPSGSGG